LEEYCFVSLEENKKIRIYDEREGHHDKNLGFINLVMETFSHFLSTSPICWSLDVHSMAPSIVQFCQSHKAIHLIKFEKFQISSHPNDNIYFFFSFWFEEKKMYLVYAPSTHDGSGEMPCYVLQCGPHLIYLQKWTRKGKSISLFSLILTIWSWWIKQERTKGVPFDSCMLYLGLQQLGREFHHSQEKWQSASLWTHI